MSDPAQMMRAAAATQGMAALFSGISQKREADAQSDVLSAEARIAGQQAVAEGDAQRRQARQFLSMQAAAIGESGTGYGGTNAKLREQSAIEAELEALNIRYGGQLKQQGLRAEAGFAKQRGTSALIGSGLAAGAALLSGKADADQFKARSLTRGY